MNSAQLGLLTPGLMPPDNSVLAEQLSASRAGMAHFGRTGPEGTTCRQCRHWGRSERFRREAGFLTPRRCQKFKSLMQGADGAGVPHGQESCRHFAERDAAPEPYKVRKRKEAAV